MSPDSIRIDGSFEPFQTFETFETFTFQTFDESFD
jgi:hypothetical protein